MVDSAGATEQVAQTDTSVTTEATHTEAVDWDARRAAAIEAVNGVKSTGKEEASEEAPKEEAKPVETDEEIKTKIFMRAKQRAQAEREAAADEARRMREQAQQELAEARRYKEEYNRLNETITKLRTRPNEAIKELGLHGEEFWQASLEEGKPDPVREVKQTVESLKAELEATKKAQQEWLEAQRQAQAQAQTRQAEERFLGMVANAKESYPTLNAIYGEDGTDELVKQAYQVADEVNRRTGNYPSLEDIAEYLEYKHNERYKRYEARQIAPVGQSQPTQIKRANGGRTLSGATSAQSATGAKPIESLSDDERLALARQAADKAIKEYRGRGAA